MRPGACGSTVAAMRLLPTGGSRPVSHGHGSIEVRDYPVLMPDSGDDPRRLRRGRR
jgi:hypothetical protein